MLSGNGRLRVGYLLLYIFLADVDLAEDHRRTAVLILCDEPARALGDEEEDDEEEEGGQPLHAQHAAPDLTDKNELQPAVGEMTGMRKVEQQIVDNISCEKAYSDSELIE